jgi:hypothetical protein
MQLQPLDSDTCGYWCIYVINELEKGRQLLDICGQFGKDYRSNDAFIAGQFKQGGSILGLVYSLIQAKPRDNFPPAVRSLLSQYGNQKVVSILVCRKPIDSMIATALNWLSLGTFNKKMKKMNYDSMFHLYLYIRLENGATISCEKNHVISMNETTPNLNNTDVRNVNVRKVITLNQLMQNAVAFRGPQFYIYDSVTANCQDFVLSILRGSDLDADVSFIKQKAEEVVPFYLRHLNKVVTDAASAADVMIHGYGVN